MGRTKMEVKRIEVERKRTSCFNKRQPGLLKKAMELHILCGSQVRPRKCARVGRAAHGAAGR